MYIVVQRKESRWRKSVGRITENRKELVYKEKLLWKKFTTKNLQQQFSCVQHLIILGFQKLKNKKNWMDSSWNFVFGKPNIFYVFKSEVCGEISGKI